MRYLFAVFVCTNPNWGSLYNWFKDELAALERWPGFIKGSQIAKHFPTMQESQDFLRVFIVVMSLYVLLFSLFMA